MSEEFSHRLRVRYGECDPQGVVYFARYPAYVDVALTELWRERVGDYMDMLERHATDMVVAEATVRFLGPAAFDDVIEFEVSVSRLGTTALGTSIRARVDGTPVAEGAMRHVLVDPATKAKKPLPPDVRAALA